MPLPFAWSSPMKAPCATSSPLSVTTGSSPTVDTGAPRCAAFSSPRLLCPPVCALSICGGRPRPRSRRGGTAHPPSLLMPGLPGSRLVSLPGCPPSVPAVSPLDFRPSPASLRSLRLPLFFFSFAGAPFGLIRASRPSPASSSPSSRVVGVSLRRVLCAVVPLCLFCVLVCRFLRAFRGRVGCVACRCCVVLSRALCGRVSVFVSSCVGYFVRLVAVLGVSSFSFLPER